MYKIISSIAIKRSAQYQQQSVANRRFATYLQNAKKKTLLCAIILLFILFRFSIKNLIRRRVSLRHTKNTHNRSICLVLTAHKQYVRVCECLTIIIKYTWRIIYGCTLANGSTLWYARYNVCHTGYILALYVCHPRGLSFLIHFFIEIWFYQIGRISGNNCNWFILFGYFWLLYDMCWLELTRNILLWLSHGVKWIVKVGSNVAMCILSICYKSSICQCIVVWSTRHSIDAPLGRS